MKKLVLSLLCAGAVSIPASAFALQTQFVYNAFIPNGPGEAMDIPVGQVLFDLDADIPAARVCRYYYEWDSAGWFPISADGYVDEVKAHGGASCITNAMVPLSTILTLDTTLPPPVVGGWLSSGFDRFQQYHFLQNLVLGQDGELPGELNGIVQFANTPTSPPSAMVNSFELEVAP